MDDILIRTFSHVIIMTQRKGRDINYGKFSQSDSYASSLRQSLTDNTIRFKIYFLFILDVIPSEQIIDIGRQARLECLTENKNGLTITW